VRNCSQQDLIAPKTARGLEGAADRRPSDSNAATAIFASFATHAPIAAVRA